MKKNPSTGLFWALGLSGVLLLTAAAPWLRNAPEEPARTLLIQHHGRVKCFDAYARQTLELICHKERWKGRSATAWILDSLADKKALVDREWLRIDYVPLIQALEMDPSKHFFSFQETTNHLMRIEEFARSAAARRDKKESVPLMERKAEQALTAYIAVEGLLSGEELKLFTTENREDWVALPRNPIMASRFDLLTKAFMEKRYPDFEKAVHDWKMDVRRGSSGAHETQTYLEAFYLKLAPFKVAWIAYLAAFILLTVPRFRQKALLAGLTLSALALLFHTAGLALRVAVLGRPPVSNMYESMIFMNWVLMVSAMIFAGIKRQTPALSTGCILSAAVMIYGSLLPVDSGLDVLVPVLRSNYWLTIHVMTIVSSYGLFGLAMGLGHRHLFREMTGRLSHAEEVSSASLMLRVVEVGVFLLGIGTVLGGVWANESWGRFWGWDPKETWALITFLGYLVLIHLHHVKLITPRLMAFSMIGGFMLVLMTWYGVNFVLGKGLHSYGQGSGGVVWIIAYLVFEALFVLAALVIRPKKSHL